MNLPLKDIVTNIPHQIIGNPDSEITNISIDSRSLQNNDNTLFFALKGNNYDAHDYIQILLGKGIKNFVVSQLPQDTNSAHFILVDDTLQALQNFAQNYRSRFSFPVVGITGSNGKTIVKEWLNFLLSPDYNIVRSPKSYNSQVGVPLSVLEMQPHHNFGIFEAGISSVNQMQNLEKIIRPTIGILTNIGDAHNEGFSSKEEKISEKVKLFQGCEVVIYQKNELVTKALDNYFVKQLVWSFTPQSDAHYIEKTISDTFTTLKFSYNAQVFEVKIPFTDYASIENAVNSMMVLLYLNYDKKAIEERMQMLYPIEMRLRVKNGINNTTLIDDSYISDLNSLKIALDFLEQQKQHLVKTVILSDILESGEDKSNLYGKIASLFKQNNISQVIGIGKDISAHQNLFDNIATFETTEQFLNEYDFSTLSNQTILIKGARPFHLEKIVDRLEEKTHQTVLEINLNAITHNLNYFKSKIKPSTKMMVMIKAFGYGSGSFEIAKLLEYHRVDYLGVAFADEGIALRNSNIKLPIIVMNPEPNTFSALIKYKLEPEIYSLKELEQFKKALLDSGKKNYPIHIKLDTGMHRLGFEEKDIAKLVEYLSANTEQFEVKSIFSHFSGSDAEQFKDFTHQQFAIFQKMASILKNELQISPICHISNTSSISNYPEFQMDMVRLGIGLYGISNDESEIQYLENVGTLKSIVLQIKDIPVGDSVGYSRGFMAEKPTRTATIPIGYADGIPRALSKGKGFVLINNQKAKIVGVICMDMLMVDVTDIDCREGDPVIIFGENLKVTEIAKSIDTIAYEILAGISQRVKRVFYRE